MAENDPNPWQHPAAPDAVAASTGATSWAVAAAHCAALPDEVAAMLAPQIIVSAAPYGAIVAVAPVKPERPRMELLNYRTNKAAPSPSPSTGRHRHRARAS